MADRIAYGNGPFQFAELTLPHGAGPHPAAMVIHGGFWRAKYKFGYMRPFCDSLAGAGVAAWNIEYRRIGNAGGGWPGTFDDIAAAAEYLSASASRLNLAPDRIVVAGHSAGGHLALWLASQKKIRLVAAISLAGVVDLRRAFELRLSQSAVVDLLGGRPDEVPDRYTFASPIEQLPFGIPQKLFHGSADASVPFEMSERYVESARRSGDDAELIACEGAGHFELVTPGTREFALVRAAAVAACSP